MGCRRLMSADDSGASATAACAAACHALVRRLQRGARALTVPSDARAGRLVAAPLVRDDARVRRSTVNVPTKRHRECARAVSATLHTRRRPSLPRCARADGAGDVRSCLALRRSSDGMRVAAIVARTSRGTPDAATSTCRTAYCTARSSRGVATHGDRAATRRADGAARRGEGVHRRRCWPADGGSCVVPRARRTAVCYQSAATVARLALVVKTLHEVAPPWRRASPLADADAMVRRRLEGGRLRQRCRRAGEDGCAAGRASSTADGAARVQAAAAPPRARRRRRRGIVLLRRTCGARRGEEPIRGEPACRRAARASCRRG